MAARIENANRERNSEESVIVYGRKTGRESHCDSERESNATNKVKVGATRREYATTIGNGILLDRERER